jgi:hypothetical protein
VRFSSPVTCIKARQGPMLPFWQPCRRVSRSAVSPVLSACWTPSGTSLCWFCDGCSGFLHASLAGDSSGRSDTRSHSVFPIRLGPAPCSRPQIPAWAAPELLSQSSSWARANPATTGTTARAVGGSPRVAWHQPPPAGQRSPSLEAASWRPLRSRQCAPSRAGNPGSGPVAGHNAEGWR